MSDDAHNQPARESTAIDAIAEKWVATAVDLNPDIAIYIGVPGRIDEYGDQSPAGLAAIIDAQKKVIAELNAEQPVDDVDRVTKTDLLAELTLDLESYDARLPERDLNVIASPAQGIREIFDLMPTATPDDWATIGRKMGNVPGAVSGYIETLRAGIADGIVPARRQVEAVAEQTRRYASADGFFQELAANAAADGEVELSGSLRADLTRGADSACCTGRGLAN